MGKKDKKKGKGLEKTVLKTEKKSTAKQKKMLAKMGEEDIETIVAQIEEEEKKKIQVKEVAVDKPNRRSNFTFAAHPLKDELILFGGEYFDGVKTLVYNDLVLYNIIKKTWTVLQVPGAPPPRCGHQMVATPTQKGQLWVFGGEFTSRTESQFHHYRDLWVFHMGDRKWEKMTAPGGPSSRSGHRMVAYKKQLIVFGGYHDNLGDYKYFNDVHFFDTETYKWTKIEPNGTPPAARSACQMIVTKDGKIMIHGGYSKEKIKKDVDKGIVHTDMFLLCPEKNDTTGLKWKWMPIKPGGCRPSPRTGCSIIVGPGDKAFAFGGVYDVVEEEEDLSGNFYNDLFVFDIERRAWRTAILTGKKEQIKKRRRKEENSEDCDQDEIEEDITEEEVIAPVTTVTDGVFTMTVGPALTAQTSETDPSQMITSSPQAFTPSPRMSCGLAVKHSLLYLYGGVFEEGDKEITFADLYRLDLHKMDEWQILLEDEEAAKEWIDEDSDDDDDEGDEDDDDDDEEDDDDDDGDESMDTD